MRRQKVVVLPGDGIGPEVTDAALNVLYRVKPDLDCELLDAGEHVIKKEGTNLPLPVLNKLKKKENLVALFIKHRK